MLQTRSHDNALVFGLFSFSHSFILIVSCVYLPPPPTQLYLPIRYAEELRCGRPQSLFQDRNAIGRRRQSLIVLFRRRSSETVLGGEDINQGATGCAKTYPLQKREIGGRKSSMRYDISDPNRDSVIAHGKCETRARMSKYRFVEDSTLKLRSTSGSGGA